MSTVSPVERYLDRLREALPPARAADVVAEVGSLIEDHIEDTGGSRDDPEAVQKALDALGRPEMLASALGGESVTIDGATRRAFFRLLAVVFAGHLLISIVLSVIGGAGSALVPGIVGPLPRHSPVATAFGVLGTLFLDAGMLGLLFLLLGRDRAPSLLLRLKLKMPGTRRDALMGLVLLGLIAVLLNVPRFRDGVFAVGGTEGRAPILAPEAISIIPFADIALFLFALRNALLLVSGGERIESLVLDALASLAGAALAVLVLTRDELVTFPDSVSLSKAQAETFADLIYRVCVVIAFVAGLLLATRFVKRIIRVKDLVRG